MNDKLTHEELIALLAQCRQMEQADAETFIDMFWKLVGEALQSDKYVNIKGLGTFKLLENDTSENVISFVPDTSLRELVNKPFSHFGAVELNDEVHFDDMEEPQAETKDVLPSSPVNETVEVEVKEDKPESVPVQQESRIGKRLFRMSWCMMACGLLVGILIGGVVCWVLLSDRRYIPEAVFLRWMQSDRQEVKELSDIGQFSDTLLAPAISSASEKSVEDDVKEQHLPIRQTVTKQFCYQKIGYDRVVYVIAGTLAFHTIRKGDSLTKIAYKFYGNKELWPYLVRYNEKVIKDPNNVPIGTVIQVPKLVIKHMEKR